MNSNISKDVVQAVILADDFTIKLSPFENIYPSILTPVVNIPLFDYMMETLIRSEIEEIFLYCSNHVAMLQRHIKEKNYENNISLIISDGCASLADALRDIDAKGLIRGYFILIRGNTFISTDLKALFAKHYSIIEKDKGAAMTMVLRNIGSTKDTLLKEETTLFVSDKDSTQLLHVAKLNKCEKKITLDMSWFLNYDSLGIDTCYLDTHVYICSPSVLPLFADNFDFQTMDDFIRGLLINEDVLDSRIYYQELNSNDYALPVTSWRTYHLLTRDILRRRTYPLVPDIHSISNNFILMPWSSYKHDTVTMAKGCSIEEDCILGKNTVVGSKTKIKKSMIADHCIIGSNVQICNSHIFSKVKIEDNCTITNSVLFWDCVVEKQSSIDGCILCPNVYIVAGSEYKENGVLIKPTCDYLSETAMSKLIDNGFLYFKNKPFNESDSSSAESSESEEDSEMSESQIPDDTNMFLSEIIDSLIRGYHDKLDCENLILEINSSRYAYNITIQEVTYNVMKAILSLPLHYLSVLKIPITKQNYLLNMKDMTSYFHNIILNYIKTTDAEKDCLRAIEDVAGKTEELLPFTPMLLHYLHQLDVLSEEKILEWYESSASDVPEDKVRKTVLPFIKWLREAEEDSESE